MLYRVIIIYFVIVLVYFKVINIENNKFAKFIFSMFIPVFGFLTVILTEMIKTKPKEEINENKINNEKEKSKEYLTKIQSSLIDNLSIGDYENAREMILSIKALNLEEHCKVCKIAIKSKNVEISHIAAVSLMRIKNYFEKLLAHMELKTDLEKIENLKKYIYGIHKYLKCELVQGALNRKYREKLIKATEELIIIDNDCEERYYGILVENCIEEGQYDKATKYLSKQMEEYGVNEEIYKLILKICIRTKDIDKFHETLKDIRENSKMVQKLDYVLEFWK